MNPEYGPFANIVALAGCIIAAAMAIALAWVRGANWQPPEEELSDATIKFSALVCGVAIAILYVIGQKDLGIGGLARLAGWSIGLAVVALLATVYLNTLYSYQEQSGARILGGYRLTDEAKSIQRRKKLTVQKIFGTVGYDKDLVWTRSSRGLVRVLSSVTYLALQTLWSIGLAAAALLMGSRGVPPPIVLPLTDWVLSSNVRFCTDNCFGRKELVCTDDLTSARKEVSKKFTVSQEQLSPNGWHLKIEFANANSVPPRSVDIDINNSWLTQDALKNIDTGGWSCDSSHLITKDVGAIPPLVLKPGDNNTITISTAGLLPHLRLVTFDPW